MTKAVAELRMERAELGDKAQAILDKAEKEKRDLTTAETVEFNAAMGKVEQLAEKIADAELVEANKKALLTQRLEEKRAAGDPFAGPAPIESAYVSNIKVKSPTLTAFRGPQAARDALDCGLWLKSTILRDDDARHKLAARRGPEWMTQNEGTGAKGGYLVPAPLHAAILEARASVGAVRQLARIIPMSSETLEVPRFDTGVSVYYPGEEGEITASDADFSKIKLECVKRAALVLMSSELADDALVSMSDWLTSELGYRFAATEDNEAINGDGTSTYGKEVGLKNAIGAGSIYTAATGVDTWPELGTSDFLGTIAKLPDRYRQRDQLRWLVSPSFKVQVMDRLALAANGATSMVIVDGIPQERFLGYPVVESTYMPSATAASTVCCYFGNFQYGMILGERNEIRVSLSEHSHFATDQVALRATSRYDILIHDAGDASNAGAIVALKTNS